MFAIQNNLFNLFLQHWIKFTNQARITILLQENYTAINCEVRLEGGKPMQLSNFWTHHLPAGVTFCMTYSH